jgi:F-type H+-transporting ATPase subunit a
MDEIGKVAYYTLGAGWLESAADRTWLTITSMDLHTLFTTYIVMILLVFAGWLIGRRPSMIPSGGQLLAEWIVDFVDTLCQESLGKNLGRSFTSFISTLFLFLLLCNYSGVFFFEEPTKDINTPLALGLMGFIISVYQSMKFKGVFGYFKEMIMEPIPIIMFPLNLIGELSKIVSISFRLFGNIMGGAVIIVVVSWLVGYLILPVGLVAFFGLFVGTIQAFVFTMLTLAYISNGIDLEATDEEAGA